MSLKNTRDSYGTIAKYLHWGTALLFLVAYASVYYRGWFTEAKTPENWTALQVHLSVGVTIGVLVVLRIISRLSQPVPDPEPGTPLEHRAAKLGHLALYAVLVIMPLTGYLGTGVATEFFFLFDIPAFKDTTLFQSLIAPHLSFEAFEKPMDLVHKKILGEWLLWILILGHAAAALYHHFIKGDRTLRRMTRG